VSMKSRAVSLLNIYSVWLAAADVNLADSNGITHLAQSKPRERVEAGLKFEKYIYELWKNCFPITHSIAD